MSQTSQEYIVRAPLENKKRYNVMRFSSNLNVDVTKWKCARLEKERTVHSEKSSVEEAPKFGFGSEFGKEAKEEARRKKLGQYMKKCNEDPPWILKVGGKYGRKFKGTREGGVTENTSYYVFFQAHDGAFEAFPISDWYNFTLVPRYKALTAEEAEEQFEKRDKILNYFSVMASKKKQDSNDGETVLDDKLMKKGKKDKDFKVTEMDEWAMDSDRSEREDSFDEDSKLDSKEKGKGKRKGKKKGKGRKGKGSDDDDDDSEPLEESDEGDFDTREVDYMSDSSSSSDGELEDKLNRELKGVEDEDALRQLVISDDEEEEEGEDNKDNNLISPEKLEPEVDLKTNEIIGKIKIKEEKSDSDSDSSSSEDSDDSNFDDSKFQSAMFMQCKAGSVKNKNGSDHSASSSQAYTPNPDTSGVGGANSKESDNLSKPNPNKRKLNESGGVPNKMARLSDSGNGKMEMITEEAVKRYLMRKPMTAIDLLQKFKCKKIPMSRDELVTTIAQILKKLSPDKQKIKDKLYFSIKPS